MRIDWTAAIAALLAGVVLALAGALSKPFANLIADWFELDRKGAGPNAYLALAGVGALLAGALVLALRRFSRRKGLAFSRDDARFKIILCALTNDLKGHLTARVGSALLRRFPNAVVIHRYHSSIEPGESIDETEIALNRRRAALDLRENNNADLVIYGDVAARATVIDLYFSAGVLGSTTHPSTFKLDDKLSLSAHFEEIFDLVLSCVAEMYAFSSPSPFSTDIEDVRRAAEKLSTLMADDRLKENTGLHYFLAELLSNYGLETFSQDHIDAAIRSFDHVLSDPDVSPLAANSCRLGKAQCLLAVGRLGNDSVKLKAAVRTLDEIDVDAYSGVNDVVPAIVEGAKGTTRAILAAAKRDCRLAGFALQYHERAIATFERLDSGHNVALAKRERAMSLSHAAKACNDRTKLEQAISEWRNLSSFDFGTPDLNAALRHELATALYDLGREANDEEYLQEALVNITEAKRVFTASESLFVYYELVRLEARTLHGLSYITATEEITAAAVDAYMELLSSGELHRDWHDRGDIFYYAGCKMIDLGRFRSSLALYSNARELLDESFEIFSENECWQCMARSRLSTAQMTVFYYDQTRLPDVLGEAKELLAECAAYLRKRQACKAGGGSMRDALLDIKVKIETMIKTREAAFSSGPWRP